MCGAGALLAKSPQPPRRVASDGAHVYWSTWGDANSQRNGSIWRASVHGGAAERLAGDAELTTDIAVDGTRVYWIGYPAHLASVPKDGGALTMLANEAEHLALDGAWVYFTRPDGVYRVAKSGGGEKRIAEGQGVDPLAVSDQVYFVERGAGVLRAAPKEGGPSHTIGSPSALTSVYELAAGELGVFGVTSDDGVVWRANDAGFVPLARGLHCPANVAAHGEDFFFGRAAIACASGVNADERAVMRWSHGQATVAAPAAQTGLTGIAVDDVNVYWAGDGVYCARR